MLHELPEPRLFLSEGAPRLRWGLIGPGWIAEAFVHALRSHTDQRIVAVAGRSFERAADFARRMDIPRAYDSAEALAADVDVDAVYVATPHPSHSHLALVAIEAGKAVLIEKPIAMTAAEARAISSAAAAAGVLAMEAMWTRFLPQSNLLHRLVNDGELGDIRFVSADFGFVAPYDRSSRLWSPEHGGGAILDAGVYPLSFVTSLMGVPDRIDVNGRLGSEGVDASASMHLQWGDTSGHVATSIEALLPTRATVVGTHGRVDIATMFLAPSELTFTPTDSTAPTLSWRDTRFDVIHDGMADEILAFASYVGAGRTDSPLHPLSTAVSVMELIDRARASLRTV